jgi:hypothetical protein
VSSFHVGVLLWSSIRLSIFLFWNFISKPLLSWGRGMWEKRSSVAGHINNMDNEECCGERRPSDVLCGLLQKIAHLRPLKIRTMVLFILIHNTSRMTSVKQWFAYAARSDGYPFTVLAHSWDDDGQPSGALYSQDISFLSTKGQSDTRK